MNDTPHHHRRWPWVWLLFVLVVVLLIFGGHWVWSTGAQRRLTHQIAQYKSAGEPIEVEDYASKNLLDADNAAIDLRAAARSIDTTTARFKAYDKLDAVLPLTEKEAKAIADVVADNKTVFDQVDHAMTKKGADWNIRFRSPVLSVLLPDLGQQRQLAALLAYHAALSHQNGDDAAAFADLRRIWFIADTVGAQPILVSALVADRCREDVNEQIEQIAPDVRIGDGHGTVAAEQLKKLITQLLDERYARPSLHRALTGERMLELDAARCIADGTLSIQNISQPVGMPAPPTPAAAAVGYLARPMALGDGLLMIRHTTEVRDAADHAANWPAFVAAVPPPPADVMNNPYAHLVARILMPSFDHAVQTGFQISASRRMAAATLAIALYRHDHAGKWPARLDDLVPAYLPAVPDDPMSKSGKIIYHATTQPIIYSVNNNGIDDGGNEMSAARTPKPSKFAGLDMVIHLTRQPRVIDENVDSEASYPTTIPTSMPASAPATTLPASPAN